MGFRLRARKLVGGWLVTAGFIDRKVVEEAAENLVGQARELIGWK